MVNLAESQRREYARRIAGDRTEFAQKAWRRPLQFFDDMGRPIGNVHVVEKGLGSDGAAPYNFYGGETRLVPFSRADHDGDPLVRRVQEIASELVPVAGSAFLSSKNLQQGTQHLQKLAEMFRHKSRLNSLDRLQFALYVQERERMKKAVDDLNIILEAGEPLWIVGRYQRDGEIPDIPAQRDIRVAAKLKAFLYSDADDMVVPFVTNAFETENGSLPPDFKPGDYSPQWLYAEGPTDEPRENFYQFGGFAAELPFDAVAR